MPRSASLEGTGGLYHPPTQKSPDYSNPKKMSRGKIPGSIILPVSRMYQ
jgi:hypothetical protein